MTIAAEVLHSLLQSEAVRAELGALAGVIEGVLTQALNGNIDSWEDLGRVALEVLDAITERLLEAQQAGSAGGSGGDIFGLVTGDARTSRASRGNQTALPVAA